MVDSHGDNDLGRRPAADDRRLQLRARARRACPHLSATVTATSYLTPVDQGITAGATPGRSRGRRGSAGDDASGRADADPAVSAAAVTPIEADQAPQFLSDVYRDLRDRHLLLPAVALLVAPDRGADAAKSPDAPALRPPPAPARPRQGLGADRRRARRRQRQRPQLPQAPRGAEVEEPVQAPVRARRSRRLGTDARPAPAARRGGDRPTTAARRRRLVDVADSRRQRRRDRDHRDGRRQHDRRHESTDRRRRRRQRQRRQRRQPAVRATTSRSSTHLVTRRVDLTIGLQSAIRSCART